MINLFVPYDFFDLLEIIATNIIIGIILQHKLKYWYMLVIIQAFHFNQISMWETIIWSTSVFNSLLLEFIFSQNVRHLSLWRLMQKWIYGPYLIWILLLSFHLRNGWDACKDINYLNGKMHVAIAWVEFYAVERI